MLVLYSPAAIAFFMPFSSCFSFQMQLLRFPKKNDGVVAQGCHCSSDLARTRATISNRRCGTVAFGGGVVIFSFD
jgi:hypothetical protein